MGYTLTLICKSDAHSKKIKTFLDSTVGSECKGISTSKQPESYSPEHITGIPNVKIHYSTLSPIAHGFLWRVFSLYAKKFKTNWYYDEQKTKKKDYQLGDIKPPSPGTHLLVKVAHKMLYDSEMKSYNRHLDNFKTLIQTLKDKTK
jgi:hypothetical protein